MAKTEDVDWILHPQKHSYYRQTMSCVLLEWSGVCGCRWIISRHLIHDIASRLMKRVLSWHNDVCVIFVIFLASYDKCLFWNLIVPILIQRQKIIPSSREFYFGLHGANTYKMMSSQLNVQLVIGIRHCYAGIWKRIGYGWYSLWCWLSEAAFF